MFKIITISLEKKTDKTLRFKVVDFKVLPLN